MKSDYSDSSLSLFFLLLLSSLVPFYLCCLLLLSVCFAVYGVPASVVNVSTSAAIMHHLYINTRGSQRKEKVLLLPADCVEQSRAGGGFNREGRGVRCCLCSLLHTTPLHRLLFPLSFGTTQTFNYNHFSMTKSFYKFCSFFFVIYRLFFFPHLCFFLCHLLVKCVGPVTQ